MTSPVHSNNPFAPIKEIGEIPLIREGENFQSLTDRIARVTEDKTPRNWWIAFGISLCFLGLLGTCVGYLLWEGIGVWGNNSPSYWGWDITNFVWWIGIGHAGTLISAILFIFRQKWRTSINRFSEAMTIFAVMCAGLYPGIHVGRAWFAYYMFPIPNQMSLWPNFKSPLMWDIFAVSTYFTVSLLFWYVGLIPDLATLRDRSENPIRRKVYGFFALGWRGSNRAWQNYERAYLILAAISTPLVLSVHSVVSFDFATSVLPGWHTTIFPPYFVAGAVYSGFGLVMTLMLVARLIYGVKSIVTEQHLELMCKVMLLTSSLVGYAYLMEFFVAWYSGNPWEKACFWLRATGPYQWAWIPMMFCNAVVPQLFWFKFFRTNLAALMVISVLVNVGMWFERFVIIVGSTYHDFIPGSWGYFRPTMIDIGTYMGTFGLFFTLFLLFLRWLPMIAIAEVKGVLPEADPHHEQGHEFHASEGGPHDPDLELAPGE